MPADLLEAPARSRPTDDPMEGPLRAAERALQREEGACLALRSWPWIFGGMLAVGAVDAIWHFSSMTRAALLAGAGLLFCGWLAVAGWIAWRRRNQLEHTARVLESRDPRLGSKLINALQLQAQRVDPAVSSLTRELAALAVSGFVEEMRRFDLPALARTQRVAEEARRLALGAAGFSALLALAYPVTRVEVPRFLDPFGDHPPFSFTRLEIIEPANDATAVVYGQSMLVRVRATGHRPGEVFLCWHAPETPKAVARAPMFDKGDQGFAQQIEGLTTPLIVYAETAGGHTVSPRRKIGVILTPKLERASVTIAPPAYTGLPAEERALQFKTLKALEGSTLTFRLMSNRPLSQGRLSVHNDAGTVQPIALVQEKENSVVGKLVARASAQLKFSLTDRDGFDSQETWELALTVTHDLPPDVQISNPNSDSFVAMDFKAEPVIEASDDYGIKTLRIHQARNGVFVEPQTFEYARPPLNARESMVFDFKHLDVESGDQISIFAEAIDNAPEPHLTRSKTVTLTVVATEEYNQYLRERTDLSDVEAKYDRLLNQFHDLIEEQKKMSERIAELERERAAAKTEAEQAALQKQFAAAVEQQRQINQRLNELAAKMDNFVRDQPLYDLEAELKQTLQEKAQEVREATAENEQALSAMAPAPPQSGAATPPPAGASGSGAPSQKTLADFQQASDAQLKKLGGTEQTAREQVTQPLADLSLMHEIVKDINRFKDLYAAQQQLAEQSKAYGRPGALGREDQLALKNLAGLQREVGEQLDAVEQKLWEDGKAAQEKFPKAGQSAQELAQQMGDLRLKALADQAAGAMVDGQGKQGAQIAEHLRSEMDKLFSQCNSRGEKMNDELDHYLRVQRSMSPGRNFRQMLQTRKFGSKSGSFNAGRGENGQGGFAVITGPNASVLGNEEAIKESDRAQQDGAGRNKARSPAASAPAAIDGQDVVKGLETRNRESSAVQGETGLEQYSDIVDKYFQAITKPAPKVPQKP